MDAVQKQAKKKKVHSHKWQDWRAFIVFKESLQYVEMWCPNLLFCFTPILNHFYSVEMEFQILLIKYKDKTKTIPKFCLIFGKFSTLP